MNLQKLYKMQEELDNHILLNNYKRTGKGIGKEKLLNNTVLALQVEIAELANATRCFKHWSTKEPESKERLLDELADILHFYLSVGNQIGFKMGNMFEYYSIKAIMNDISEDKTYSFVRLMVTANKIIDNLEYYTVFGHRLLTLGELLGFTDEEVEQAYLNKHKENYRRQREGY